MISSQEHFNHIKHCLEQKLSARFGIEVKLTREEMYDIEATTQSLIRQATSGSLESMEMYKGLYIEARKLLDIYQAWEVYVESKERLEGEEHERERNLTHSQ